MSTRIVRFLRGRCARPASFPSSPPLRRLIGCRGGSTDGTPAPAGRSGRTGRAGPPARPAAERRKRGHERPGPEQAGAGGNAGAAERPASAGSGGAGRARRDAPDGGAGGAGGKRHRRRRAAGGRRAAEPPAGAAARRNAGTGGRRRRAAARGRASAASPPTRRRARRSIRPFAGGTTGPVAQRRQHRHRVRADGVGQHGQRPLPSGSKYLLGFNEPNFKAQANLTPQAAANAWPALQTNGRNAGVHRSSARA